MHFDVTGVSNTGNAAVIPEDSYWRTSDKNIGEIDSETGIFTAVSNGTVTVEYVVNGEVKGSKEIGVVIPDETVEKARKRDRHFRENFEDAESMQYFQLALRRKGIIEALEEKGIKDKDTVRIYDLEFEYYK